MSLKDSKHIHFTGIKGVGMTSLALCAQDLGIKVTGSDVEEEFVTDETLKKRGIQWKIGFSENNLDPKPDVVVTTGAHGGLNNPEILAARKMGIPVMTHAEALAQFAEGKTTIAVCGVGGKTTTCAMIATILEHAGLNPSYAIGVADIPSTGTPGKYNKTGEYFVCEADEFAISPGIDNRPRWSYLTPQIIVVTNIEHDHPDIYLTFTDTKKVFREVFEKLPSNGFLVVNGYDGHVSDDLLHSIKAQVIEYGERPQCADYEIGAITYSEQQTKFTLLISQQQTITLQAPGKFNCYNATAAFAVCHKLGLDPKTIVEGLKKYTGCKRRFEKIAEINDMLFFDDYAHHPKEIKATLKAAREWFPNRRIIALFQPHTYSRTKALFNEFVHSFDDADIIGIADIFSSARETDTLGVSGQSLGDAVSKVHKDGGYAGSKEEIIEYLKEQMKPGDIFITLGAGDVYKIHKEVIRELDK